MKTPDTFLFPETPTVRAPLVLIAEQVFAGEYDAPGLPSEAATVLDIGANIGMFAVWARRKWPMARILCYEPNPDAVEYCRRNAPYADVYQHAVTTSPQPQLVMHADWGMNYTRHVADLAVATYREQQEVLATIDVPVVHPRALPGCDILKIDAEGVEPEILEHYPHLATVKACLYEYHSPDHRFRCRGQCEAAGMRLVKHEVYNAVQGTDIWLRGA